MKKATEKVSANKQYKDIVSWGNTFFASRHLVAPADQGLDLAVTLSNEISKQLANLRSQKLARR